jgi:RNA polymerase sigma-32 factor
MTTRPQDVQDVQDDGPTPAGAGPAEPPKGGRPPRSRTAGSARKVAATRPAAKRARGPGAATADRPGDDNDDQNENDDRHERPELEPEDELRDEDVLAAGAVPVEEAAEPEPDEAEGGGLADGEPRAALVPVSPGTELTSGPVRDPLGRFLAEVRRHPRLTDEQERELGRAVRERGDAEAAKRLVVHNLRLVVSIAHKYRRAWANILDLFQEGSVGLMEAVKRWEPDLGPRFGSYAAYWIRAYVLKFLMTNSRLVHVGNTRAGRKLFFRLERERQQLMSAGFEPTPKLLAARLDVDEDELEAVRAHLGSREVSFDPGVGGAGGAEAEDSYPLSERVAMVQPSPERSAATAEMSASLHEAMQGFAGSLDDPRERAIWQEHLAAEEPVSLGEIGSRFGVSKQRMGQIADKLKARFRERIVTRLGPEIRTDWLSDEE